MKLILCVVGSQVSNSGTSSVVAKFKSSAMATDTSYTAVVNALANVNMPDVDHLTSLKGQEKAVKDQKRTLSKQVKQ